ncbi:MULTISPECIES: HEPN/Toprim-associated domain-containing protein [Vibrio]|uniref:HEPN/Toprim-associated domain-containing protein n=1 Tax=Vibrio TaxID=662 RepID=UPI000B540B2D|nr:MULTISPECIES: HEPN/Toprim-associated domain-containing protein [Vibrio]ASF99681.1 hypothetical protein CEG15_05750 [Vibrio anguillarum]MDQ2165734.1 hypothetical protein [Vibrio anguillarum]NNN97138.1 hypothetical protein [Vibrio sp. B4-6]TQQ58821.1 hypothetical protein FLL61_13785 [Vibrio cholerae]
MGSYAGVNIGDHELWSWKNYYDQWYFTKQDRVREVSSDDESNNFIGYKIDAKALTRRLQLAGYDLNSARYDFEEVKASWISEMKESLGYDHGEDSALSHEITENLKVVEAHSFDDWLRALPRALELSQNRFEDGNFDSKIQIEGEPLLSFMLSEFYGVYDGNQGFAGAMFPCKRVETYALVLLEISSDDVVCTLDITDLVSGGWVDDFDDVAQVQVGETHFYGLLTASLDELNTLSSTSENPVLQRMVFASVITTMEAYLSDTMKRHVLNRDAIKRRFVESHTSFSKKMNKSEVFAFLDNLDRTLNEEIDRISFHNIDIVKELYKRVLLCEFPEDLLSKLRPLIFIRHDIVHRNGKKTDGNIVSVSQQDVVELIELVTNVTKAIDLQIIDGMLVDLV